MFQNKWLKVSLLSFGIAALFAPHAEATKINTTKVGGVNTAPLGTWLYVGGTNTLGTSENGRVNGGYVYAGFGNGAIYSGEALANSASTAATEQKVLAVAMERTAGLISDRIAEAGGAQPTASLGASSGNNCHRKLGVWVRGGYNNIKNDETNAKWNADLYSVALGADYKFHPTVLAGLAFIYSNLNGDTDFNKGSIKDNAYGFAPYLNWKPVKWFSMDIMGAYSWVNKERDRTGLDLAGNFTGAKITAKPKSKRWFVGGYGNFMHSINKTNLLARLGITHAEDKQDEFTESNGDRYTNMKTKLTTLHARLQAGYKVNTQLEPYIFGTYAYDINRSNLLTADPAPGNYTPNYTNPAKTRNRNTYGGGAGLKMGITNAVSGGVEYQYSQSKKLKIHGVTATLRYVF